MRGRAVDREQVAQAVADRTPVNWDALREETSDPREAALLGNLKVVAGIARFCRGLQEGTVEATAHDESVDWPSRASEQDDASGRAASAKKGGARHASWGHLQILEKVGEGSFGQVFRAWDSKLYKEVALKLLRGPESAGEEWTSQAITEARLLARVEHRSISRVYGVDRFEGRVGFWMEFVQGPTLHDLVREQGPLSEADTNWIGRELCSALTAIHDAGVIHRDIKANNVMRDNKGRIVITDFGCGIPRNVSNRLDGGSIAGTPAYMAPELLEGEEASPRTDMYSLGVLLFYLATGEVPEQVSSAGDLRRARQEGRRRTLRELRPDISESCAAVIDQAIARDPNQRFRTLSDMGAALVEASRRGKGRRNAFFAWGLLGVAILIVVLTILSLESQLFRSFAVDAALVRFHEQGEREILHEGNWIRPGDRLALELETSQDIYAYVINRDQKGRYYLLFPLPGYDLQNPLAGNSDHRLPGSLDGQEKAWVVSSAGGKEYFYLIAARERLEDFEREIAAIPVAGEEASGLPREISETTVRTITRGIGDVVDVGLAEPPSTPTPEEILRAIQDMSKQEKKERGVWVQEMVLENPEP
jgi:serine/threonine protein kinase